MSYQISVAFGLIYAVAFSSVVCSTETVSSNIEVTAVNNLTEYLSANTDIKLLQQLSAEPLQRSLSSRLGYTYRHGGRIRGDSLQATDSHEAQWGNPQNIRSTLRYPRAGIGAFVTYVHIDIEQSTNLGRAYFIEGGIGQRRVTIIIEAEQTLYYSYRAYIYGRNY